MRATRLAALTLVVPFLVSAWAQAKPVSNDSHRHAHAAHGARKAPQNIQPPKIVGVMKVGHVLKTKGGRWTNRPSHYYYRWSSCAKKSRNHTCKRITGAKRSTYRVVRRDVGRILKVAVTAQNAQGAATVAAPATRAVTRAPQTRNRSTSQPSNLALPMISGSAAVGRTLTASTGTWANHPTGFAYQWEDCDPLGAPCTGISGATSSRYILGAGDVGSAVEVVVTASNAYGSATATSNASSAVVAALQAPANAAAPTIAGTAAVGNSLTVENGSWSGSPTQYSYQWMDCNRSGASCTPISGATSISHEVDSGDEVHTIRVSVTATNSAGSTSASSAATSVIATSPPPAPVNTAAPVISGSAAVGDVLSTTNGSWTNTPTGYSYRWKDCDSAGASCANVGSSGTSANYTVQSSDAGHTLVVVVTASNGGGSAAQSSSPTWTVASESTNGTTGSTNGTTGSTNGTTGSTNGTTGSTVGAPGDLFVSASAEASGDGSQSAPFRTIAQCAAAVTAGHTCWIETGTYTDKNVCSATGGSSSTNMVTFENYPGESPVMNGGGASADAFVCANKNYVRVSGLTITDYDPPDEVGADGSGAITFGNSVGPEVDHNTISNITTSGNQDAGIFIYNTSTTQSPFTILDNQVSTVTETGVTNGEQDDIWVAAGDYYSGGLIQGNIVSGAGKDGIRLECGTHTSTVTVQDNIATHNTADGIQVNNCYATTSVLVHNNFVGWTTNENLMVKHSQNVMFMNNTSVQPTTGVTDCGGFKCLNASDGMEILGEDGFDSTGGFGSVDGGNWNLTVENNVFYGGNGLEIGAGDYAVIKNNNGVINYNDWYGWSSYMSYADEHVLGDGGYDYFNSIAAFTASTGFEANGLASNPMFTNATTGNYTLQSSSPLVGKSSTGGSLGADPSQLAGVGPVGDQGLSNIGT
jgi:large repetitive protein